MMSATDIHINREVVVAQNVEPLRNAVESDETGPDRQLFKQFSV